MSSEIAGPLERASERYRAARSTWRILAIESLGPVTVVGGIVWAILQPYRIVFFYREGMGFYDYLMQPPLLVVAVGLLFALVVAPGLSEDLLSAGDTEG